MHILVPFIKIPLFDSLNAYTHLLGTSCICHKANAQATNLDF